MSIFVLLSPIHFFPVLSIYESKTSIFSIQREMIITSLFRKLTKVSTNNFKRDVKVPKAAECKDVCLQNTSKSHSYNLKIWRLL